MSSLKANDCFQIRNERATEIYRVKYQTALVEAAHTLAEKLIKLCMTDIAKRLLDETVKKSWQCD